MPTRGDKTHTGCIDGITSQSDSNNAPRVQTLEVKLTHPCHPLHGALLKFILGPKTTSRDWVIVELGGTSTPPAEDEQIFQKCKIAVRSPGAA